MKDRDSFNFVSVSTPSISMKAYYCSFPQTTIYPAETSAIGPTLRLDYDLTSCSAVGIFCLHSRGITSSCNFPFLPLTISVHVRGTMRFETRTNAC